MTKPETIAALVPQTHNALSEAAGWLIAVSIAAIVFYAAFGWIVCKIADGKIKRAQPKQKPLRLA